MKLIIWLWNPWEKYEKTRHNVGFLFLDWLKSNLSITDDFKNESKFKWEILETIISWQKTILLKPQTFMNLSWESVIKVMNFYKIDKKDIIVIFDDISLDFWKVRFRESWSSGWQNWVKNIIANIWEDFKRIKIGVWQDKRYELSDWVLSKFSSEELEKLNKEIFFEVYEKLLKNL
jgi:PTH1 family peptidyl-tRNA hydrolase